MSVKKSRMPGSDRCAVAVFANERGRSVLHTQLPHLKRRSLHRRNVTLRKRDLVHQPVGSGLFGQVVATNNLIQTGNGLGVG